MVCFICLLRVAQYFLRGRHRSEAGGEPFVVLRAVRDLLLPLQRPSPQKSGRFDLPVAGLLRVPTFGGRGRRFGGTDGAASFKKQPLNPWCDLSHRGESLFFGLSMQGGVSWNPPVRWLADNQGHNQFAHLKRSGSGTRSAGDPPQEASL